MENKKKSIILVLSIVFICVLMFGKGINVSAAEASLQPKKWASGATSQNEADNMYYKIKIPKMGYIKVEYFLDKEPEFTSDLYLYDKNKKKISTSVNYMKKHTAYWAVRKGTYFLKAGNTSEWAGAGKPDENGDYTEFAYVPYNYKIRYTFTALKKSGSKATRMSKASELKRGKTAKGLVFPNDKEGVRAVYKMKVSKNGKVTLHLKVNSSYALADSLQIRLYDAKGRMLTDGKYKKDMVYWYNSGKSKVNLKAGTYYLGIYKFISNGSGFYSIRWK